MQGILCYKIKRANDLDANEQEGGGTGVNIDRSAIIRDNRQISFQLEHAASRALAQKGLTGIQAQMLLYILSHSEKGTSLTDIHREFGHSMAALCGVVKRLREKDYVRVEPCAGDDRRKLLFVTGKGEEVRDFLDRSILWTQDRLYDGFSQQELASLDRMQKKMLRNLSALTRSDCKKEET